MDTPVFLTAIAAILSAVAWPIVVGVLLLAYREPISAVASRLPQMFDRVRSLKLGALEADMERVIALPQGSDPKGGITVEQVKLAAKIESQAGDLGERELFRQLDRLCLEYDTIREALPSGYERTAAMTNVLIKMRTLAPSTSSKLEIYKGSGSPGSRLAAIAMMQMEPHLGDLVWLGERFRVENPFIFYHAALALKNIAIHADHARKQELIKVAREAKVAVEAFEYGVPDPDTIEVLSTIT